MSTYELVSIGRLKPAEDNIRQDVGDVSELAASIKAGGVLQALLVDETSMVVVAGARRLAAAKKAGLKEVPVVLRSFTEQERLETMIVENLQREDLTPLEEASAFKRLADLGLTQRQIAERVGRAQSHVAKRLSLLTLPEAVQKQVDSGGITLPDAQELAKIKDDPTLVEQLVDAATKKGAYAPSISSKVAQEQTRRETEKKRSAAKSALEKAGEKVIDVETDVYGFRVQLPEGMKEVRAQAYTAEFVEMAPAKHAKLECHAVYVDPREMKPVEVCTNPDSHPSKADQIKAERQKEAARVKKAREAFDAMTARRRDYVEVLIQARVDRDALLELAYLALMKGERWSYNASADEFELACELLRLEKPGDEVAGHDQIEWDVLLDSEAAKSASARHRVTLAIAAGKFEIGLERDGRWTDDRPYFDWLKGRGYELSAYEKSLLDDASDEGEKEEVEEVTAA